MNGIQDITKKGSDPLLQTARGKLQSRRSKLNVQINKELRMRAGAENLYRATGNKKLKETVALELSFVNSNLQLLKEELSDLNSSVEVYQNNRTNTVFNKLLEGVIQVVFSQDTHYFSAALSVPMIPLGLKETKEVDFSVPFKDYISEHYSEEGNNYEFEMQELMDMRQAVRTPQRSENGVELLFQYYNQLYCVEKRFFDYERSLGIFFQWYDSLTGVPCAQKTVGFEKGSILFNIGALYTQIGARQDRTKIEGVEAAIENFQKAAGAFTYLRDRFSHAPSMDMQPHTLVMLVQLMLSQAQECVFEKRVLGGVKEGMQNYVDVAHEAAMVAKFYDETHKMMCQPQLKDYVPFSWISMVLVKSQHFKALSHYYTASGIIDQKDSGNVELLGRLFTGLHVENSPVSFASEKAPTKLEERKRLGKAHLREALILHEDSMRVHNLCKQLRKIDTFQEVLKHSHDRSLAKFGDLEEEDDFSELIAVPPIKPTSKQNVKVTMPDFGKYKVKDLFEKLGPITIFSARHNWSAPRKIIMNKSPTEGYGFSVRGDSPVIVAAVEEGSKAMDAGMKIGDFIIGVDTTDTKWSKHDEMVMLIRAAGDELRMKLVTPMDKNYLQPSQVHSAPPTPASVIRMQGTGSGRSSKSSRSKISVGIFKKKDSKEKRTKDRASLGSDGSSGINR